PPPGLHRSRTLAGGSPSRRPPDGPGLDRRRTARAIPGRRGPGESPGEPPAAGRRQGVQPAGRQRDHRGHRPQAETAPVPPRRSRPRMNSVALLTLVLIAQAQDAPLEGGVPRLQREAEALAPLVSTKLARDFLGATKALPRIAPRKLYRDKDRPRYL